MSENFKRMIFNRNTNFEEIIQSNSFIKRRRFCIKLDNHGKSSFVFFVKCESEEFVFKFPRTQFQAKLLIYENQILKKIKNKLTHAISDHTLFYDFMNRPYIVYSKIEGYNMADFVFSDLDYEKISLELAKEIYRVHSINSKDIEGVELYTKKELLDMFCSDFDYIPDYSHISEMLNDETLIHGDFHRHNILLNDRKEVVAILDFATFSKGSIYFDIGHMILSVKSPAFSVSFAAPVCTGGILSGFPHAARPPGPPQCTKAAPHRLFHVPGRSGTHRQKSDAFSQRSDCPAGNSRFSRHRRSYPRTAAACCAISRTP